VDDRVHVSNCNDTSSTCSINPSVASTQPVLQPITSAAELKAAVDALRDGLARPETEDSWDSISRNIQALALICHSAASELPNDLVHTLRSLARPLTSSMVSERTRLSGPAIDLVRVVASGLGPSFDPLIPTFLPVLLAICGRTNKVIITRARTCITTIIETTQLPSILPYFLQSIKDKSATLRLAAAEGTLTCLNCFNPPDLEKESRARDVEAVIRSTATDAQADIRAIGRKLFDAYKLLLPGRVERSAPCSGSLQLPRILNLGHSFTAPLTPTIKKYLDIKTSDARSRPTLPRLTPTLELKSNSSSTSGTFTQRPQPPRPATHVRSASSTVLPTAPTKTGADQAIQPVQRKKQASDMPPPEYVPVRPRSGQGTSVSRSTSDTDGAKGMTIPLVRPGLPVTHPTLSSAIPARTTSTNTVNGPHRPLQHPANASQEHSSGPRRILIPYPAVQRQRVNSTSTLLTKFTPSDSKGARSHTTIAVPGKSKPLAKAPAAQLSSSSDKVLPEKAPRVRGIMQPTLSQMSRAKATAKEKVPAAAPLKQNTWGRPPPQNGKKLIQSGSICHPVPKTTAKTLSRPASRTADVRPATPAQIPLPPSPAPTIEAEGTLTEPPTPSASAKLLIDIDTDGTAPDQSAHCSTPTSPRTSSDTALTHLPCIDVIEPEAAAAECPQEEDQDDHVVVQTSEPEEASPLPASVVSDSSTPRTLLSPQDTVDCSHKTPISALLSSIQRGFLFTPSSPLSPPESYLQKYPVTNSLPVPFPLTTQPQCQEDGAKLTQSKGPFMFGIGVGELERTTLGSVENLDI